MNDIIFSVLQIIVSIAVILITRYVIPYIRLKVTNIINETVFNEILKMVKSVEQDPDFILSYGSDKKEEVIVRITEWVNAHGISISQKQISRLIETAVYTMKKEDPDE